MGAQLEKVRKEVEMHTIFLCLCRQLVEINEKICRLRPVKEAKDEKEFEALKKIAEAILGEMTQEVNRIVRRVFQDIKRLGQVDLEASEMAMRASSHQMGGSLLKKLLNWDGGGYRGVALECPKGHRAQFTEYRDKQLLTALSRVLVKRAYYHCEE
jgi:hypothetical protein